MFSRFSSLRSGKIGSGVVLGLGLLGLTAGTAAQSGSAPRATLAGVVTGTDAKPLHGVAVSARASGTTVTTTVFTDQEGEYFFGPLAPGTYRMWAQTVGYERVVDEKVLDGTRPIRHSFTLTPRDPAAQLTSSEWLAALPEATKDQRRMKQLVNANCTYCHTAATALAPQFDETAWLAYLDWRLSRTQLDACDSGGCVETRDQHTTIKYHRDELARYLATVRGPGSAPLRFKLHPRPTGDAARVIITEFAIPIANSPAGLAWFEGTNWAEEPVGGGDRGNPIHSAAIDNSGNVWITAHGRSQAWGTVARLNPKTAQVTGFKVLNPDGSVRQTHSITRDQKGDIWFASQPNLVRLDPETEAFEMYVPPPFMGRGSGVRTMAAVDGQGKIWTATLYGGIRFDPDTKKWTYLQNVTPGDGFNYGAAGDADGNGWWAQHQMDRMGKGDPRTGKTWEIILRPPWLDAEDATTPADREFYQSVGALNWGRVVFVPGAQVPRRIGADLTGDSIWVANYLGDNVARINIRTHAVSYYRFPAGTKPYMAVADRFHNGWTVTTGDNQVVKVNPQTGQMTAYWLPAKGCGARDIVVDDERDEVWVPCRETSQMTRLQFRTAEQLQALKAGGGQR